VEAEAGPQTTDTRAPFIDSLLSLGQTTVDLEGGAAFKLKLIMPVFSMMLAITMLMHRFSTM
jgi:hypothetical protein